MYFIMKPASMFSLESLPVVLVEPNVNGPTVMFCIAVLTALVIC